MTLSKRDKKTTLRIIGELADLQYFMECNDPNRSLYVDLSIKHLLGYARRVNRRMTTEK